MYTYLSIYLSIYIYIYLNLSIIYMRMRTRSVRERCMPWNLVVLGAAVLGMPHWSWPLNTHKYIDR